MFAVKFEIAMGAMVIRILASRITSAPVCVCVLHLYQHLFHAVEWFWYKQLTVVVKIE